MCFSRDVFLSELYSWFVRTFLNKTVQNLSFYTIRLVYVHYIFPMTVSLNSSNVF